METADLLAHTFAPKGTPTRCLGLDSRCGYAPLPARDQAVRKTIGQTVQQAIAEARPLHFR